MVETSSSKQRRLVFFVNSRSGSRDAAALRERIERRAKTHGDCSTIVLDDYDGNETALKEKVRFETSRRRDDDFGGRPTRCEQSRAGETGRCRGRFLC